MGKNRWRDIGNGKIKCEKTGEIARLTATRQLVTEEEHDRTIMFTSKEWERLQKLARKRSTLKHKWTPEECVHDFVATCQPGDIGWIHPLMMKPEKP